ncbi:CHAT domain-containing protein [Pseudenhygromyxa sp. WMMC2535]|uniref:CHAT domain-containing protein n=1 Tax=Pseudenhygromyxa sp. WMMC2535 TaxID=2712867 RepID=UPI001595662D|nr:CHAT domain-containing protein [Pseudenhygromyxa sp. WMMC2535]NVB40381.1 CHAT domain-containing protein [Pseudenhygromyxa sp. WMMC2535]
MASVLVALGPAGGCESGVSQAPAQDSAPELSVSVAGCRELYVGSLRPRCARESTFPVTTRLWVPGRWGAEDFELRLDGEVPGDVHTPRVDSEGALFELSAATVGELELRHAGGARFRLALEPAVSMAGLEEPWHELLACGLAELGEGPLARLAVRVHAGWLASLEARWPGAGLAVQRLVAGARGEVACVDRSVAALELFAQLEGFELARAAATQASLRHDPRDLEGRLLHDYFEGIRAEKLGALDEALDRYAGVVALAEDVGEPGYLGAAISLRAVLLTRLGRFADAAALARRSEALPSSERELLALNAAWVDYLRREHDVAAPDPTPRLRALLAALGEDSPLRPKAQVNLAAALIQSGELEAAERTLAEVEPAALDLRDQLYYELSWCRVELGQGALARARARLEAAERLAELGGAREFVLELLGERAELERRSGDRQAALAVYDRAETLADELALQLPADGLRTSFTTALSRARARHVALLAELERPEDALCTILAARARHARALIARPGRALDDPRYLELLGRYHELGEVVSEALVTRRGASVAELETIDAQLERLQGERTELLREALAVLERDPPSWRCALALPRGPREGLLTMYPDAEASGWWLAFARGEQAVVEHLDASGALEDALVERGLAQLDAAGLLSGLTQLTVVPVGRLAAIDVHDLPRMRSPQAPRVRYSVALGAARGAAELGEEAGPAMDARVLAYGDDLAEVDAETEAVAGLLEARGWSLGQRWSPVEADPPTLLHYAGHGRRAGISGWDSGLARASGLEPRVLIAGQRAPRYVVLGACDTGTSDLDTIDGGMNMAFAFLLAGAEVVIAPDQPVDDQVARRFAEALYAELPRARVPGSAQWQAALTEIQRRDPAFAAWRAWVR